MCGLLVEQKSDSRSKSEADLHFAVLQLGYGDFRDQGAVAHRARRPRRKTPRLVEPFDVAPIGRDEIGVPLVERRHANLVQQPHAETGGLMFVRVQDAHEEGPIGCVLEIAQLVLERGRHPLDRMAEQVQKQKALHLESDVRIEHDAQAVEDAGPWRLQVPVFEDEAVLDNARSHAAPQVDERFARHAADEAGAGDLVPLKRLHHQTHAARQCPGGPASFIACYDATEPLRATLGTPATGPRAAKGAS
jgi:hypothetical protein